eukprot:IDg11733t1
MRLASQSTVIPVILISFFPAVLVPISSVAGLSCPSRWPLCLILRLLCLLGASCSPRRVFVPQSASVAAPEASVPAGAFLFLRGGLSWLSLPLYLPQRPLWRQKPNALIVLSRGRTGRTVYSPTASRVSHPITGNGESPLCSQHDRTPYELYTYCGAFKRCAPWTRWRVLQGLAPLAFQQGRSEYLLH